MRARAFQHGGNGVREHGGRALESAGEIIGAGRHMRGADVAVTIDQHQRGLRAATVDAEEHQQLAAGKAWICTPLTTRLTVPEALG